MSGATLLRGEILAPAAMLTSIAWLLILGAASLAGNLQVGFLQPLVEDRLSYMMAALLLAPGMILAELTRAERHGRVVPGLDFDRRYEIARC